MARPIAHALPRFEQLAGLIDHEAAPARRILLVDDEVEFVETLAERLRLRGYRPAVACSGPEALSRICEAVPQLVILDMYMPGMSGLDLLKMLHFSHPNVKTIILTGHESVREAMECRRLGAFDYLTKPISIDTLLSRMEEALEGARVAGRT